MKRLLSIALATAGLALWPLPAAAQDAAGDKVTVLEVFGDDPCPQTTADEIKELAHGAVRVDLYGHGAFWKDKRVALTATEFAILQTLLRQPQRVFSRDRLIDAAYQGQVTVTDRTIDSHMRNLRAKYAKAGCKDLVETVHGVGYKLGPCR